MKKRFFPPGNAAFGLALAALVFAGTTPLAARAAERMVLAEHFAETG